MLPTGTGTGGNMGLGVREVLADSPPRRQADRGVRGTEGLLGSLGAPPPPLPFCLLPRPKVLGAQNGKKKPSWRARSS